MGYGDSYSAINYMKNDIVTAEYEPIDRLQSHHKHQEVKERTKAIVCVLLLRESFQSVLEALIVDRAYPRKRRRAVIENQKINYHHQSRKKKTEKCSIQLLSIPL